MTDREKIIDKIKKCLALAKSSNEHEAAAALRQAQKLMQAHGISDLDMSAAEATEARAKAGATRRPAGWETYLAGHVADAFGCKLMFTSSWSQGGEWAFIGTGAGPEVAEYSFKVLLRQGKAARAEYIKAKLKRCKPGTKTRRADLFSEGWVASVVSLVERFSAPESSESAIDAYMAIKYPTTTSLKTSDRNADRKLREHEWRDRGAGYQAGQDAQLNRGIGGAGEQLLIGGQS